MSELNQEEILLSSDDGSVTLTTHRVIKETGETRSQILLEDFKNYELKTIHIGYSKILSKIITIIFLIITIFFILSRINLYLETRDLPYNSDAGLFEILFSGGNIYFVLSILGLSIFLFVIAKRHMIYINGRHNTIEIRVRNRSKKSLRRFLETLESQSDKIKKQKF